MATRGRAAAFDDVSAIVAMDPDRFAEFVLVRQCVVERPVEGSGCRLGECERSACDANIYNRRPIVGEPRRPGSSNGDSITGKFLDQERVYSVSSREDFPRTHVSVPLGPLSMRICVWRVNRRV
ncbi:hypothetical protein C479_15517 [Halovivax asiaticus JCM 14624]|uniref:Uncharacterized protein n=1 Tax=Halovivax asiaticus JCM 14624 TaxID=1227490 RepID=M0B8R6_9EURY|nr:hypothetical protein C479_15517 [Halovivax asiaticus JCM 14624]